MIFVTIGSMFPFDRMIRAMDGLAGGEDLDAGEEILTQIGEGEILAQIGEGAYEPAHMRWVRSLERAEYAACVARARLIVAHAGVGSVIAAAEHGKPIVVVPRRAHLGEHTSDHQLETADWLRDKPGVHVALTEAELAPRIAAALAERAETGPRIVPTADPAFLARIRDFIQR